MFALICLKSKFCILNVTCAVILSNYYENFHIFKPGSHFPLFSVCHLKFTFLYVSRVSVKNYLKIHNIQIVHKTSGVGRSYEKCTHWEVLGFPSKVQAPIRGTGILKSLIYIYSRRNFYLKLLLISFNHVNNVMDVYTQPGKRQFLCPIY